MAWHKETVTLTVTSDKEQTIELSVYGGEKQTLTFTAGEPKTITLNR